ncbi:MAG TPA: CapA family protein [Terriglobales bacterium]|nr:CapA family protein [Terriglobales bacterium]
MAAALLPFAWAGAPAPRPAPTPPSAVKLVFTGDILLARQVAVEMRFRRASPWTQIAPVLHQADWSLGNLEGAVGDAHACLPARRLHDGHPDLSPCFAVAPSAIAPLRAAGFAAIGIANNHSRDLGAPGVAATRRALAAAGLEPLAFSNSPVFVTVKGVTLGLVALDAIPARDGAQQTIPSPQLARKLRLARALSNLVVVYIHWGTELHDWPSGAQQRQAAWLVAQGADLVVGSHPHVVEAPACVQGKPVFYSLGNLLFDQKFAATRIGMLAVCDIRHHRLACTARRTAPPAHSFFPAPFGDDAAADRTLAACRPRLHPTLEVAGDHLLQAGVTAHGERILAAAGPGGHRLWTARPTELLSLEPASFAPANTPTPPPVLFTLERHPSPLDGEDSVRPYVYQLGPAGPIARWRGTALAWPLLDARVLPTAPATLCALHRTDSFLMPNPKAKGFRIAAYRWDGFGFAGLHDPAVLAQCRTLLTPEETFPPPLN